MRRTGPAPPRATFEIDIDLLAPNDYQPRAHVRRRAPAGSGAIDQVQRRDPADRRPQDGRLATRGGRAIRSSPASAAGVPRRLAGLLRVPVVVKDVDGDDKQRRLEMALIENVQREDLNPIEEAHAYQRLADEFGLKQDEIAAQVGKDRSSVANTLRLLRLPDEVRAEVAAGRLSMGHARAIVSLSSDADQRRIARDVLAAQSLRARDGSDRQEIGRCRHAAAPAPTKPPRQNDVHTRAAEEQLRLALGTAVAIKRRGKGGRVEIAFANEDELQRVRISDERRTKDEELRTERRTRNEGRQRTPNVRTRTERDERADHA